MPEGPYRIVASSVAVPPAQGARPAAQADPPAAESDGQVAEAWVTVADRRVYPRRPGFITIAIDPGHGGSLDGAVGRDGTREADLNLDIGLRLARMLEGAGVDVVVTRPATATSTSRPSTSPATASSTRPMSWRHARTSPTALAPTSSSPSTTTRP